MEFTRWWPRSEIKLLKRWIPNPGTPCSKPIGGSKVDSVFHPSEVNQMSTRNSWEIGGKNCLLVVALQPWGSSNPSIKRALNFFFIRMRTFLLICHLYKWQNCIKNAAPCQRVLKEVLRVLLRPKSSAVLDVKLTWNWRNWNF